MDKEMKVFGAIVIIIANVLMIGNIDFFEDMYDELTAECFINIIMAILAYYLIVMYSYNKRQKYEFDKKIYIKYVIISLIIYIIITRFIAVIPVNNEIINKIISNEIVMYILQSIYAGGKEMLVYKYGGIFIALVITYGYFGLNEYARKHMKNDNEKSSTENNQEIINVNTLENNNQNTFQDEASYGIQNNDNITITTDKPKLTNIKSVISGIIAGMIVIACQGLGGLLIYLYNSLRFIQL